MTPLELYNFIKSNIENENRCVEAIAGCFLREQIEGIRSSQFSYQEFIKRDKRCVNIDTDYPIRTIPNRQSDRVIEIAKTDTNEC